jgi:acyl carrier protein
MSDIRERCIKVMAQIMEIEHTEIADDSSPENLEQWDSLSHVQLVLNLEKEFSIKISPEEGIEYFIDLISIVEYIRGKTD